MFYPCHNKQFLFLAIAKNACASLKGAILREKGQKIPEKNSEVHGLLGYQHNGTTCISPKAACSDKFKEYVKFAVWRDPASRFDSLARWVNGEGRSRQRWAYFLERLENVTPVNALALAKAELDRPGILEIDEHIRAQFQSLQLAPVLDYIVPIDCLNVFMEEKFSIELPELNVTEIASVLPVSERSHDAVKSLYKQDYMLPVWYGDKFFVPNGLIDTESTGSLKRESIRERIDLVLVLQSESQIPNLCKVLDARIFREVTVFNVSGEDVNSAGSLLEEDRYPELNQISECSSIDTVRDFIYDTRKNCDYVFLMYGDETVSITTKWTYPLDGDQCAVEIQLPDSSSRSSIRLFKSGDLPLITLTGLSPSCNHEFDLYPGITIRKDTRLDLVKEAISKDLIYLDTQLDARNFDAGSVYLHLGDLHSNLGRPEHAFLAYQQSLEVTSEPSTASYLLFQQADQRRQQHAEHSLVLDLFEHAWNACKEKIEPLYEIIKLLRHCGETEAATRAAKYMVKAPFSSLDTYFDRSVYEYKARAELAMLCLENREYETAMSQFEIIDGKPMSANYLNWLKPVIQKTAGQLDQMRSQLVPVQTESCGPRRLTIGMATYDDYDGVYFSVMAIRLFHPEVTDLTEIIVIDNNPGGVCSEELRSLANRVENYRYIPLGGVNSTAVRDAIFVESNADYVLCIDSHVMMEPGSIEKYIGYLDENPDCADLLQGPLIDDSLHSASTHFSPGWQAGMYGTWDCDPRGKDRNAEPFEIPMQGLGLFGCRKDAWPGFNPRFRGFGGEEGYIHQKFRNAGRTTLCLPFLRWIHRFARPMGAHYEIKWKDRIRNYYLGFSEVGLDVDEMQAHFEGLLGNAMVAESIHAIELEQTNPFHFFDAIFCINLDHQVERWQDMQAQFDRLGITDQVVRLSAVETKTNHHIGCALSHRLIIEYAKRRRLGNVLVLEDDAIFHAESLQILEKTIPELALQDWNLFYLGGHKWDTKLKVCDGCQNLSVSTGVTMTHAIAYNGQVFDHLLSELPSNFDDMSHWVDENLAIDQYLRIVEKQFMVEPTVVSQPHLYETQDGWKRLYESNVQ